MFRVFSSPLDKRMATASRIHLLAVVLTACASVAAGEFTIKEIDGGLEVQQDGKLVTRYLTRSGAKPILWPVIGPEGAEMTRGYPMRDVAPKEKKDHVHHRSFWFTHGDVNGVSFWHENDSHGVIEHRRFDKISGGETATIVTTNDWTHKGKRHCQDVRTIVIGGDFDQRLIDFDITLSAPDGPVVFGDTKEGSFGLRVAGSMRTELKEGGRIVNTHGQTDAEAWGKAAPWVDYSGPVGDQQVGVAIMNHPSSFRFPTYWHVRTYGLFAANPFGLHDFKRSKEFDGSHKLAKGESFRLRYRVLIHSGDEKEGKVAAAYKAYAESK